jgi:tight adherence protein C
MAVMDQAGIRTPVDRLVGGRFALATVGAILGLAFAPFPPLSAAGLAFAGYRVPDALIRLRAANRRDEISAAIPDVVDLLAVCAQAGLSLPLALARVAERAPGVLGAELKRVVQQIGLGVPRAQALRELSARNDAPELETLATTLVNAERFGTRIASTLATLSAEIRGKRRRRAEEEARRAPVKILFPLVFLILPGFILITLVPLLLGAFATLGF